MNREVHVQFSLAWSQDAGNADDIRQGHRLASERCSICHVATPDQATRPTLHAPAPPFAMILQRKDLTLNRDLAKRSKSAGFVPRALQVGESFIPPEQQWAECGIARARHYDNELHPATRWPN